MLIFLCWTYWLLYNFYAVEIDHPSQIVKHLQLGSLACATKESAKTCLTFKHSSIDQQSITLFFVF